jgi:hypothetical protein
MTAKIRNNTHLTGIISYIFQQKEAFYKATKGKAINATKLNIYFFNQ